MEDKANNESSILIVDDTPQNIQVLGNILRQQNYKVEFSTDGETALNWINKKPFDLILLDIMMPKMDGFAVCQQIRNEPKFNNLPIIFITAKTDRESIIKGFDLGAQDYITKPFNSAELLVRVQTHIGIKQSRDAINNTNQYLEKQVQSRTKHLEEINSELSLLDEVKGEFLNMLSRELRIPINGILGPLQLLKARSENGDLIFLINMLDSSVDRFEKFSYSALLINRIKSGKYKIKPSCFNLRELIEIIVIKFNDILDTKKIALNIEDVQRDLEIESDSDLLFEVLTRIIDNALKYTPANSSVTIKAFNDNGCAKIEITDSGEGFPDKLLNNEIKLFNPGEKHVNLNTGMNLYLVKQIMDYLNGSLELSNTSENGACVKLGINSKNGT